MSLNQNRICLTWLLLGLLSTSVVAQNRIDLDGTASPGAIARQTQSRLQRVFGYIQPTELRVPATTRIAYFKDGSFSKGEKGVKKVGLRIGDVYRFKVTGINGFEGLELYPSVEIIDRLYPAADKYTDFPVPVQITQDDLENALAGKLITKIIYLENPREALPSADIKAYQRTLLVGSGEDPLKEAHRLGRPMAILRLGSRTPDANDIGVFGAPVITDYAELAKMPHGDGARKSPDGKPWPLDEYLFDGGDKNRKARISDDFTVRGVDVEDTIVHFDTIEGERKVHESNSVPIYSPRFASIAKVFGFLVSQQNEKFMGVVNREGLINRRGTDYIGRSNQQLQPKGTITSKSVGMFRDRTKGIGTSNSLTPHVAISDLSLYEDFQVVRLGHMKNNESLRLNIGLQAAQEWDHYASVQVVVDNQTTNVAQRVQTAQEVNRSEPIPGSSKVRIIKLSNKSDAQPGEIVEFTIRFDNVGQKEVGNVTIIDNLTTRLQLVEKSDECTIDHDFLTQKNEKDSLLLRWEITNPLKPGEGGVIRFKCRVQ